MQAELDIERLKTYLNKVIGGCTGEMKLTKFAGGESNPTFRLDTASETYVLRRQPAGKLLKSAHAVDREFRVMRALQDTGVPVPKVIHLCADTSVIGSMFYLMEHVEGRIFLNAALPEVSSTERRDMYDEMNRVLAALHSVDVDAVGLTDFGRPGDYFARQLKRWTAQYRASEFQHIEEMERLINWLNENMPDDDGRQSLIHGDYRLGNVVFHPQQAKIIAVLDWELSTLGHPFADIAFQCMQLRMPGKNASLSGLAGVDRGALNIPTEEDYLRAYCERMGFAEIPCWEFYLIFNFFRLAAILQGVAKRGQLGNASSSKADTMGTLVRPLADTAMQIAASISSSRV